MDTLQTFITSFAVLFLGGWLGAAAERFTYRFHVSRTLLWRKRCGNCFSPQAWTSALPVCGFVFQRGVCSSCRALLPLSEVIMEAVGALVLWGVYRGVFYGQLPYSITEWVRFGLLAAIACGVIILFISDLRYDELPLIVYKVTALLIVGALYLGGGYAAVLSGGIAALIAGIVMFALAAISKFEWVHGHDVLLGMIVGLIVGWPVITVTLALTYLFAIIGGLAGHAYSVSFYKGISSFGVYLFVALAVQGALSLFRLVV